MKRMRTTAIAAMAAAALAFGTVPAVGQEANSSSTSEQGSSSAADSTTGAEADQSSDLTWDELSSTDEDSIAKKITTGITLAMAIAALGAVFATLGKHFIDLGR